MLIDDIPVEVLLRRKVKLLDGDGETVELGSLSDKSAVVLLGDPGMGKSASLKALAASAGRASQDVRTFLAGSPEKPGNRPIFLDALDETMAVRNDLSVLDQAAGRLREMGWPPFWIACRHADWARTDGKILLEELLRGRLTVVHLLPLDRAEVRETACRSRIDAAPFMTAMDEADLFPILGNPETLRLALQIFDEDGPPASKSDLYEKATSRLAGESNGRRLRAGLTKPGVEIKEAAGALAATLLLSGEDEIVAPGHSIDRGVPIEKFGELVKVGHIEEVLACRLSMSMEVGLWKFCHRTLAEYLAAGFLVNRVSKHGFPLTRVLAMLCGDDGEVKPTLRGLFAWLAALLPGRAQEFVGRDPFGVVAYGDTSVLPVAALRALFSGLRRLVDIDPYFRSGRWRDPGFKVFSDIEFAPDLIEVLHERPVRPHLLSCVFDALEQGKGLPVLAAELTAFVTDASVNLDTRKAALYALVACSTADEATGLFQRMLKDDWLDPFKQLSAALLKLLYPKKLGTRHLLDFIGRFVLLEGEGQRDLHLHFYLANQIPVGAEAEILDGMMRIPALLEQDRSPLSCWDEMKQLARTLFVRAITGENFVEPGTAVHWLPLVEGHEDSIRSRDEMKEALDRRPDCYAPFLLWASGAEAKAEDRPFTAKMHCNHRLPQLRPPANAAHAMLSLVEAGPDEVGADVIYVAALEFLIAEEPKDSAPFERFWLLGEATDRLRGLRDKVLFSDLGYQCHRWDHANRHKVQAQKTSDDRERTRADIHSKLAQIRLGKSDALAWLARYWLGLMWHVGDANVGREEKMSALLSDESAAAAKEGFRAVALTAELFRPDGVISWAKQNSHPLRRYPMLAGADLLFLDNSEAFMKLPVDRLMSFVCLWFAYPTLDPDNQDGFESRAWPSQVFDRFPEESHRVMLQLLRPYLDGELATSSRIDELFSNERLVPTRVRLLPDILKWVHPSSPYFNQVIRNAAAHLDRPVFTYAVADRVARASGCAHDELWKFLLLGWRLEPERYEDAVRAEIDGNDALLLGLMSELGSDYDNFHPDAVLPITLRHRVLAVELARSQFPPNPMPTGAWTPPSDYERANFVNRHILAIGETPGDGSRAALESFLESPALAAFGDSLKHALANWRRNNRPEDAERPRPVFVARSLAAGAPATSNELHAFVRDHLADLGAALKTERDNLWISFWNVDGNNRPTDARPENNCSELLAGMIRGRLERAGLSAEVEARHVNGTRCDVTVRATGAAVPIEAKCDWNDDLWIGWQTQLRDRYACEPTARGFGIYLVYWFGEMRGDSRRVPSGHAPANARDCEEILKGLMAAEAPKLMPVVLDLTPMSSRSEERKARRPQ